MANFVFVVVACASVVAVVVTGASDIQSIHPNQTSPVLSEKEAEDFTDSEYIPVVDKENINKTDESSTEIALTSDPESEPSPEFKVSVSIAERDFKNTLSEQSSSVSSDKTSSSKITTDELSSVSNEKQESSTEYSNTSFDDSTSSKDSSSSSDVAIGKSDSGIVSATSIFLTSEINSSPEPSSSVTGLSNANSDSSLSTSNPTPPVSKGISAITLTPTYFSSSTVNDKSTSDVVPPVSKDVSTVNSAPTDFSSSTAISDKNTSDVIPPVSKDVSAITSTQTDSSSTVAISDKSTTSTGNTITTEDTSITDIQTTASNDEPKPVTETSTTATDGDLISSSTAVEKTTSSLPEVTTEHIKHIVMPGLKKIKLGLAITFLSIALLAMAGIIFYMIKMRRPTNPYEELTLEP